MRIIYGEMKNAEDAVYKLYNAVYGVSSGILYRMRTNDAK